MHLIIKNHAFDHQESSMESTSIIHGINKHYFINKRQECYSIKDNITSLIVTFKRYALVLCPIQGRGWRGLKVNRQMSHSGQFFFFEGFPNHSRMFDKLHNKNFKEQLSDALNSNNYSTKSSKDAKPIKMNH